MYVDLETQLSDHSVQGEGRHPLPTREALQAAARSWGLEDGDPVVVYDDWNGFGAARAWLTGLSSILGRTVQAGSQRRARPARRIRNTVAKFPDSMGWGKNRMNADGISNNLPARASYRLKP